jgi:hypothetical protein
LGLQKLCNHLGKPGKNINEDIGALVADGLPKKIQQSLDILRITGNCAVHPGELVVDDNLELATKLFQLINLVAFHLITAPKQIDALYEAMPQGARDAVEKRDTKKPK